MKGMSNNQIILSEAEKLAPATLHAIATAHHTAAQIEALAAQITVTEDDGTQHPGTTHDAEIMLAASELHTFDYWKKEGKSVKLHEKALIECYLWKYTTKPSKAQREAAEAEGKEAAPDPHYYPTKSHLFSCLQVQDSKPAPAGRFSSTAEIIAYNKKLAAERKAAKIDLDKLYTLYTAEYSHLYNSDDPDDEKAEQNAAKVFDDKSQNDPVFHALVDRMIHKLDDFISSDREAAAFVLALDKLNAPEQPAPAPVIVEERHELPELVHVDPLPKKPAKRTTTKPKSSTAALKQTERKAKAAFLAVPETDRKAQAEALSAWRKARKDVAEAENAPAAVQQLDFASIAAGLLA